MLAQLCREGRVRHVLQVDVDGRVDVAARHGIGAVAILDGHPHSPGQAAFQTAAGDPAQFLVEAPFQTDRAAVAQHVTHAACGQASEGTNAYRTLLDDEPAGIATHPEQRKVLEGTHGVVVHLALQQVVAFTPGSGVEQFVLPGVGRALGEKAGQVPAEGVEVLVEHGLGEAIGAGVHAHLVLGHAGGQQAAVLAVDVATVGGHGAVGGGHVLGTGHPLLAFHQLDGEQLHHDGEREQHEGRVDEGHAQADGALFVAAHGRCSSSSGSTLIL